MTSRPRNIFIILATIFIISLFISYVFIGVEGNNGKAKSSLPDYGNAYSDHGF